ncbi:hypothetical protein GTW23_22615 [Hoeflea alexandrii]|uniref:Uncharacterized protein n=1 Tax=Hoeflea alexandrii TaxID=288436 RepID=A0ABT1CXT4_9HYPH|nr:hypothetical protein [Hoeflea alexandrii]
MTNPFGWGVLAASLSTLLVLVFGLVVLSIALIAEEPWLQEKYGAEYQN